ncbi:M56 family metallopeptidase [Hymenobacter sp. HDW8]|uniref:M56 family metallopeptidase n=1 Tax=Hymenobacter sp. HDW8 TaxID=2714932 RepID=UPI001408DAEA|nr:M56 family metallopeptidase [Hymenobacter sp. HDW8]QIL76287.1 TonB family protein [Hymenobacter sp. HDW8]
MNPISLLKWMVLSALLLGVWWFCYHLALRRERSFGYNRVFLVLGPLLAVGLPLLPLSWPSTWGANSGPLLPGITTVLLPTAQVNAPASNTVLDWSLWLWVGYVGGVLAMMARLSFGLTKLWLCTRNLPREKQEGYTLVRTQGLPPTSSFGQIVFWEDSLPLSPAEAQQVLHHELGHVQQGHTYDRLLLEVLRAVLWFNPFVHLCARALTLTHEYLADAAALSANTAFSNTASHSYTHLLARQVATRLGFSIPLAHSFSHTQTLRRIAMIHRTSPISRWKQWLALPLVAVLMVTVACEQHKESIAPHKGASSLNAEVPPPPPPPPPAPDAEPAPPPPPPAAATSTTQDARYAYEQAMLPLPEPVFPTGNNADITTFIQSKLQYPAEAIRDKVKGSVHVAFTVKEDGQVADANVLQGIGSGCDEAALKAVRQLPRFMPGRQNGKPVPVRFIVFVQFAPYSAPISNLFGGLTGLKGC